jgi:Flp pilus assembly protein TadG
LKRRQQGALALEFAPLFVVFFGLFYAIVSYSLAILLQQAFTQAAAEGARAVVRVDPVSFTSEAAYLAAVRQAARLRVLDTLSWTSSAVRARVDTPSGIAVTRTAQGGISVTVRYANYASAPILPSMDLPGLGKIPALPTDLLGRSVVQP